MKSPFEPNHERPKGHTHLTPVPHVNIYRYLGTYICKFCYLRTYGLPPRSSRSRGSWLGWSLTEEWGYGPIPSSQAWKG
jgi:hypothetical protein